MWCWSDGGCGVVVVGWWGSSQSLGFSFSQGEQLSKFYMHIMEDFCIKQLMIFDSIQVDEKD